MTSKKHVFQTPQSSYIWTLTMTMCRKIRPTRSRDEPPWSLSEGLATGAVRSPNLAWSMRDDHVMSKDLKAAWVLGKRFIKLSPLLNKQVCFTTHRIPKSMPLTLHLLIPSPEWVVRTQLWLWQHKTFSSLSWIKFTMWKGWKQINSNF